MPWRINKAIDFRHDSSNGLGAGRGFSDSCVPVEDIALIKAKKESKDYLCCPLYQTPIVSPNWVKIAIEPDAL
ncbi:hypothetical protein NC651_029499 [Populus alba x Populus x berolinensis]|nr:hypothetical protein NC651_029499 [Populus alba x Populus x berolinensis]